VEAAEFTHLAFQVTLSSVTIICNVTLVVTSEDKLWDLTKLGVRILPAQLINF